MRFRFSLRLLLLSVTICAVVLGIGVNFVYGVKEAVRRQHLARIKLKEMGCQFDPESFSRTERPTIFVSLVRSWIDPQAYDPIGRVFAHDCPDAKQVLRELKDVHGVEHLSLNDLTVDAEVCKLLAVHPHLELFVDSMFVDQGNANSQVQHLPNLVEISIGDPVDASCVKFLSQQVQLTSLSLDTSELSEQHLQEFAELRALRTVSIHNRLKNTSSMGALIAEKRLDELRIIIGPNCDTVIRDLATAERLGNLSITIDKGSPEGFFPLLSKASKLEGVRIVGYRPVTDATGFSKLRACQSLKACELGWTVIDAGELKSMSRMPLLEKLEFCGAISEMDLWDFLVINPQCVLEMRVPPDVETASYFARRFFLEKEELVIEEVPHPEWCGVAALSARPEPLKRTRLARF